MRTTDFENLGKHIEQVVQEHIAASRRAAEAAVARAFAAASTPRRPSAAPRAEPGRRRRLSELADLGEQLYRAVCAKPGEGMTALAVALGASAKELHRPMAHLKSA